MSMLNANYQKCTWSRCIYHYWKCQPLPNIRKFCLPLLTKIVGLKLIIIMTAHAVTAGKVREPPAGPGGQAARPCIQIAVRCIRAHPLELHPLLIDTTCMLNHKGYGSTVRGCTVTPPHLACFMAVAAIAAASGMWCAAGNRNSLSFQTAKATGGLRLEALYHHILYMLGHSFGQADRARK